MEGKALKQHQREGMYFLGGEDNLLGCFQSLLIRLTNVEVLVREGLGCVLLGCLFGGPVRLTNIEVLPTSNYSMIRQDS